MLLSLLVLIACDGGGAPDSDDGATTAPAGEPIVVYWTVDTLGMRAANETGLCERLQEVFASYGRDIACVGGAVPASTWTEESHVRTLWPHHMVGGLQANELPEPGGPSFLEILAETHDLAYLFASDNATFVRNDGEDAWTQGADEAWVYDKFEESMLVGEAQTAVHDGLVELLDRSSNGAGLAVYFNDFEAGGHGPRCVSDPYTEACEEIWQEALAQGVVTDAEDRATAFFEKDLVFQLAMSLAPKYGEDSEGLRSLYWSTITEAIVHFREERFVPRLETLLAGLESQGRVDDLTIVVAGDHGENPCVPMSLTGNLNCAHFGVPNEWTGRVPVFVSPAELATEWQGAGLMGSDDSPWSLPNVAWAVLDSQGVEAPLTWPDVMPVGAATSWLCHDGHVSGTHVEGTQSVRCEDDQCAAFDWNYPDELTADPVNLGGVPDSLLPWVSQTNGFPNPFLAACQGDSGGW